jgi:hypothetical protein
VKASEPELAEVIPDDEPPDAAAVATRALVVAGSPVVGVAYVVTGPAVGDGLALVGGAAVVGESAAGGAEVGAAVAGGAVVGAAVVGGAVVGGPEVADEVAIVGDCGEPTGALELIPVGTLLLAYAMHESASAEPDTVRLSLTLLSWLTVTGPPVAVKGPTVPAVGGITRRSPDDGTGFGSTALKLIDPVEIEAGVAPLASTAPVAVPAMALLPSAAAADAIEAGTLTWVW